MKAMFSIGPFTIHFFGIMVAIGVLIGYLLATKEASRKGLDEDNFINLLFLSILGGFLGARLGYILLYNPGYYFSNPIEIFSIHQGGLSIHGGIFGGLITGIIYGRLRQLPLWKIADTVAPALILGQAIGRVGCDVFGVPMGQSYFWGITVDGVLVHPVQVYEFILDFLLFGYLWLRRLNLKYDGQLLVNYLLIFPIIRSTVELFRTNPQFIDLLSISHLPSIVLITIGLVLRRHLMQSYAYPSYQVSSIPKREIVAISVIVPILIIISLVIFYGVQG